MRSPSPRIQPFYSLPGFAPPGGVTQSPVIEQIGIGDGETTDFATSFAQIPASTVVKVDGEIRDTDNIRQHAKS